MHVRRYSSVVSRFLEALDAMIASSSSDRSIMTVTVRFPDLSGGFSGDLAVMTLLLPNTSRQRSPTTGPPGHSRGAKAPMRGLPYSRRARGWRSVRNPSAPGSSGCPAHKSATGLKPRQGHKGPLLFAALVPAAGLRRRHLRCVNGVEGRSSRGVHGVKPLPLGDATGNGVTPLPSRADIRAWLATRDKSLSGLIASG